MKAVQEKIQKAYEIGKKTFLEGGTLLPTHSKELMELLEDLEVGEGAEEIIKSFQKGFIEA